MPRCYLIIGEVGAGEGGEGAAGRPGQDVLTLQGRVDAGLGEDEEGQVLEPEAVLRCNLKM